MFCVVLFSARVFLSQPPASVYPRGRWPCPDCGAGRKGLNGPADTQGRAACPQGWGLGPGECRASSWQDPPVWVSAPTGLPRGCCSAFESLSQQMSPLGAELQEDEWEEIGQGGGRSQDPPAVWPCFSPPAPSGPVSSPVKWPLVMSVSEARLRTGEARQAGPSLLPALLPTPAPVSVPLGHLRGVGPGRACDPRARPRPGPEASHLFTGA